MKWIRKRQRQLRLAFDVIEHADSWARIVFKSQLIVLPLALWKLADLLRLLLSAC